MRGDSGQLVEGRHDGKSAGVERRLVGRQIDFAQSALGQVDGIVVETRFGRSVSGKMLGGRQEMLIGLEVGALESLDSRRREQATEQNVLAPALHAAAPALVARNVDHRREVPVDAGASRFERSDLCGAARELGLEARNLGQRHREDGPMAVDDVGGEDQRDLQPRFLHRGVLHDPRHARAVPVEHSGELTQPGLLDLFRKVAVARWIERCRGPAAPGRGHQAQLARFFLEGHPADEIVDESGRFEPAGRLQQRPRRACQPGSHSTSAHQRRPARNARVEHQLSPCSSVGRLGGSPSPEEPA